MPVTRFLSIGAADRFAMASVWAPLCLAHVQTLVNMGDSEVWNAGQIPPTCAQTFIVWAPGGNILRMPNDTTMELGPNVPYKTFFMEVCTSVACLCAPSCTCDLAFACWRASTQCMQQLSGRCWRLAAFKSLVLLWVVSDRQCSQVCRCITTMSTMSPMRQTRRHWPSTTRASHGSSCAFLACPALGRPTVSYGCMHGHCHGKVACQPCSYSMAASVHQAASWRSCCTIGWLSMNVDTAVDTCICTSAAFRHDTVSCHETARCSTAFVLQGIMVLDRQRSEDWDHST
jgi:hypothetical protein